MMSRWSLMEWWERLPRALTETGTEAEAEAAAMRDLVAGPGAGSDSGALSSSRGDCEPDESRMVWAPSSTWLRVRRRDAGVLRALRVMISVSASVSASALFGDVLCFSFWFGVRGDVFSAVAPAPRPAGAVGVVFRAAAAGCFLPALPLCIAAARWADPTRGSGVVTPASLALRSAISSYASLSEGTSYGSLSPCPCVDSWAAGLADAVFGADAATFVCPRAGAGVVGADGRVRCARLHISAVAVMDGGAVDGGIVAAFLLLSVLGVAAEGRAAPGSWPWSCSCRNTDLPFGAAVLTALRVSVFTAGRSGGEKGSAWGFLDTTPVISRPSSLACCG